MSERAIDVFGFTGYRMAAKEHEMHVEHFESWAQGEIRETYLSRLTELGYTIGDVYLALNEDDETDVVRAHREAERVALNRGDELGLGTELAALVVL